MLLVTLIYMLNKINNFKPTTSLELMKFIGVQVLMGTLKLSRLKTYWNQHLGISAINNTMSYGRFLQLRSTIHFVDKTKVNSDCGDKLYLVRPLINCVLKRCREHIMEEELSIDEQMIPCKAHLSIKQYMRGKPYPWGIKVHSILFNFSKYS